mmetsp:Transcript_41689/g.126444  ORF Transcript_41689/g.126444 Transcript_41689/m.126444 type:complete len:332 (+) Transcript_41689:4354-5349(+)
MRPSSVLGSRSGSSLGAFLVIVVFFGGIEPFKSALPVGLLLGDVHNLDVAGGQALGGQGNLVHRPLLPLGSLGFLPFAINFALLLVLGGDLPLGVAAARVVQPVRDVPPELGGDGDRAQPAAIVPPPVRHASLPRRFFACAVRTRPVPVGLDPSLPGAPVRERHPAVPLGGQHRIPYLLGPAPHLVGDLDEARYAVRGGLSSRQHEVGAEPGGGGWRRGRLAGGGREAHAHVVEQFDEFGIGRVAELAVVPRVEEGGQGRQGLVSPLGCGCLRFFFLPLLIAVLGLGLGLDLSLGLGGGPEAQPLQRGPEALVVVPTHGGPVAVMTRVGGE